MPRNEQNSYTLRQVIGNAAAGALGQWKGEAGLHVVVIQVLIRARTTLPWQDALKVVVVLAWGGTYGGGGPRRLSIVATAAGWRAVGRRGLLLHPARVGLLD